MLKGLKNRLGAYIFDCVKNGIAGIKTIRRISKNTLLVEVFWNAEESLAQRIKGSYLGKKGRFFSSFLKMPDLVILVAGLMFLFVFLKKRGGGVIV